MTEASFSPNWASHPGNTLLDIINCNKITPEVAANKLRIPLPKLRRILSGKGPIDVEIANSIESVFGGSSRFWINRQNQYDLDLEALARRTKEDKEWILKLPLSDMIKNEWIDIPCNKFETKLKACLDYFGCTSVPDWYTRNRDILSATAFRISSSFDSTPESIVTWIQYGINQSKNIQCNEWSREKFIESLPEVRKLTRLKSPSEFIPRIRSIFAESGVVLAIAKTPSHCHASGAVTTVQSRKLMLLSFRHLTDDHFWFSLFHEAGHLVLHDSERLILEYKNGSNLQIEQEANRFAEDILIPIQLKDEFNLLEEKNWKGIVRFARKAGISNGIVVGQLQNKGVVRHGNLGKLKTKFRWT